MTRLFLPDGANSGEIVSFTLVMIAYFFLVAVCIVLPIPAGLFIPSLLVGALLGRIVAECVSVTSKYDALSSLLGYEPGVFAVVGAAAFAAGVTRAISTSVIVVEVTGQPHLLLPVSIGVLSAFFVANRVSKPVYNTLLEANAFPSLRKVSYETGNGMARSIMHPLPRKQMFTLDSKIRDANRALAVSSPAGVFPVVNNLEDMVLIGEVQRRDLVKVTNRAMDVALGTAHDSESSALYVSTPGSKSEQESSQLLPESRQSSSMPSATKKSPLDEPLPFAVEDGMVSEHFPQLSKMSQSRSRYAVKVDPSPICVSTTTTIHKVDVLFRALRLSALYLHDDSNRFIGRITRSSFMRATRH